MSDLYVEKIFLQGINDILRDDGFVVIRCSIPKEPYIRPHGKLNDVYGPSLSCIMERVVFYLDSLGIADIELSSSIERRGKKGNAALLNLLQPIARLSNIRVDSIRMKKIFKEFEMRRKTGGE